ncbi:MAG: hypothetical protein M3O86_06185, partial [Actinomycetota bacterium]|nr:hypothetical protein [Actinomycetota bacterium]
MRSSGGDECGGGPPVCLDGLTAHQLVELVRDIADRLGADAAEHAAAAVTRRLAGVRLVVAAGNTVAQLTAEPLDGAVDDAALTASVERLHRLEAAVTAEKLRRLREVHARAAYTATGDRSTGELLTRLGLT